MAGRAGRPKGKQNYPVELETLAKALLRDNMELRGKELKAKIETARPEINYSVRTYQTVKEKVLQTARALKELDQPWHLGMLDDPNYVINPEAVSRLLKLLKWLRINKIGPKRISVRQAKWIGRLYASIDGDQELYEASLQYSLREIIHEISQSENNKSLFDTSELDDALSKGVEELMKLKTTLENEQSAMALLRLLGIHTEDGEK